MSVAIYISAEREVEGLDTFVNGKAFGRASDEDLSRLCAAASVGSPFDYVSEDPEALREMLEDADADLPDPFPEEAWFAPSEGIAWVDTLSAYLRSNPAASEDATALLEDLDEYAAVLKELECHGVRWHFTVDF